jgi:hypothetical protein
MFDAVSFGLVPVLKFLKANVLNEMDFIRIRARYGPIALLQAIQPVSVSCVSPAHTPQSREC